MCGNDTETNVPSESLVTIQEDEEENSVDVPDLTDCKTITEILIKLLQTADQKRLVRIFYVLRLVVKTKSVLEDLVQKGLLSMLVKYTFSGNTRVARNACAALYELAANSSEDSLMPVEEFKGFIVNDEMLIDFMSKLGHVSQKQKETSIRVLILCGFSFSDLVLSKFPSLSSFYQEIQQKISKKNKEFMVKNSIVPVEILGVFANYLIFSTSPSPSHSFDE